ncbi:MAG: type II toxin-antitoxin system VapC family toxin [Anaerolineales bacterium]|nr:type II toxin-antitoxin system VapC family toxin [Anaerolineales bacterium]
MNVIDSSGWIEYVTDEDNADFFDPPINDTENLLVPTICLYEVFKCVLREFGEERALDAMGLMTLGQVIDLDRQAAINAAQISLDLKLGMADSIILATARLYDAVLWTQDEHFEDIEGVKYVEKKRP